MPVSSSCTLLIWWSSICASLSRPRQYDAHVPEGKQPSILRPADRLQRRCGDFRIALAQQIPVVGPCGYQTKPLANDVPIEVIAKHVRQFAIEIIRAYREQQQLISVGNQIDRIGMHNPTIGFDASDRRRNESRHSADRWCYRRRDRTERTLSTRSQHQRFPGQRVPPTIRGWADAVYRVCLPAAGPSRPGIR